MAVSEGKFARCHGGLSFFAEVAVDVESSSSTPGIEIRCSGRGFLSQGYVEDVPANGYDDWKAGAEQGAAFALRTAEALSARVIVTRISGLATDTNPTVVGAAAAIAVWQALAFSPSVEVMASVQNIVYHSWQLPADELHSLPNKGMHASGSNRVNAH